ncbi:hypothetical protein, partial [Salmonella sp. s51228]|uniref:hypothetical protein n=1 Tax=Salmonella sp. s51228 TaxID=3159652 RepID=UPI00398039E7
QHTRQNMASKTLLFLLGLTIIAVAYGAWEEETEELTQEDLQQFFMPMEKRGKVGPCERPDGRTCAICNLKIKNHKDMRRYIACGSAGRGRGI